MNSIQKCQKYQGNYLQFINYKYLLLFREEKTLGLKYSKSTWKSETLFCWHWAVTQWRTLPLDCKQYFVLEAPFSTVNCSTRMGHPGLGEICHAVPQSPGKPHGQSQCKMVQSRADFQTACRHFWSKSPELRNSFVQACRPCSPGTWSLKDQLGGFGERWAIC